MEKQLSPSKIIELFNCEYKFYLIYIKEIQYTIVSTKFLDIGDYIHKIIEIYYKNLNINLISKLNFDLYKKYIKIAISKIRDLKLNLDPKFEDIIKSNLIGFREYELERFNYFIEKYEKIDDTFKPKYLELKLQDEHFRGIVDCIFEYKDEIILSDWKTSNILEKDDNYILQLRIYQYLYEKEFKKRVNYVESVILRTNKTIRIKSLRNIGEFIYKLRKKIINILKRIFEQKFEGYGKYCHSCGLISLCGGNPIDL